MRTCVCVQFHVVICHGISSSTIDLMFFIMQCVYVCTCVRARVYVHACMCDCMYT